MQAFSFTSGNMSASESDGTEMRMFDNRRQKASRRQPDSAQSDDAENMEDLNVTSSPIASTDFNYFHSLSPLQNGHLKTRSFEKLDAEGFNGGGYLSDSSLPSVRQSLARSRHLDIDIHEGTPLLSRQHSVANLERIEQALEGEGDDNIVQTPGSKRKHAIKKYGMQIKITILCAIMLASVVSHCGVFDNCPP